MNCRQCDCTLQRAAKRLYAVTWWKKSHCGPLWVLRTNSSKEKARISKNSWHLNTVYIVSWWVTVWSWQDKNDYKMADKVHLTTRLTVRSTRGKHVRLTRRGWKGNYVKWHVENATVSASKRWTYSAFHNTMLLLIQMAWVHRNMWYTVNMALSAFC